MRTIICLLTLLFMWLEPLSAQEVTVQVLDKITEEPVIRAHVMDEDGTVLTVTDIDGYFSIDPEQHAHIRLTAVGYSSKHIHLHAGIEFIHLNPAIFRDSKELMVVANKDGDNNVHAYHNQKASTEMAEFLDNIDGISTNKRGAFGWEPVVRGQSDQRMNLVIDGMQVFKACVDKMDPITSYVETNNLSKLEIDKSGTGVAQNGTGNSTVNLVTQKAESNLFSMDINAAYRMPDQFRNFSVTGNTSDASGRNAVRFSGSYKKADDFTAGNNQTINNTQYEKLNLNLSYRHTFPSKHSIEAGYITDKAYDIGYPALLMDATKALADIGQVQFNFASSDKKYRIKSIQLYANSIRHTMDDYSRDVANRPVMRGMHMPMYGETTTFGARFNGSLPKNTQWYLNSYTSEAYGDMEMNSLDQDVQDMFIYNLDEVKTNEVNVGLRHRFELSNSLLFKLEESIRFKSLRTDSENYGSFFEGLYDRELTPRNKFLLSASGSLLWLLNNEWSLSGNVVYSERMGNHMELFGHYIYNYVDGYFYDGNPWLKTERSINTDLNTTWENEQHSLSLTLFHKQYFNYIDGILAENVSTPDFQFKQYANVGDATISGFEIRSINKISHHISFDNRVSYLYAQNQTLGEPLPLIPPLKGNNSIHFHHKQNMIMTEVEWAAAQGRIAQTASNEDETDAYAVLNFTYERTWMNGNLSSILSINNLLDDYYHTHTSIGNVPEAGRNVMLSLRYQF
ncbi:TonB-dependent receptor [Gracilimonas sp. BCB1]|uniref:TonB-dependent receptor n=1 Tax=Gracilimonas sp. BCB1 TaxID=3152362 RepID=UPI0032D95935